MRGFAGAMARSGHFSRARGSPSKKSLHASEQDRPDIARRRERWKKYQGRLDAKRLVFIDETPACAGAGLYGVGSVKRDFSIRGELAVVHANARYTLGPLAASVRKFTARAERGQPGVASPASSCGQPRK